MSLILTTFAPTADYFLYKGFVIEIFNSCFKRPIIITLALQYITLYINSTLQFLFRESPRQNP